MLLYSNFVCYNQVFAPKSGLLSQKMPNAALIKSAVVFADTVVKEFEGREIQNLKKDNDLIIF